MITKKASLKTETLIDAIRVKPYLVLDVYDASGKFLDLELSDIVDGGSNLIFMCEKGGVKAAPISTKQITKLVDLKDYQGTTIVFEIDGKSYDVEDFDTSDKSIKVTLKGTVTASAKSVGTFASLNLRDLEKQGITKKDLEVDASLDTSAENKAEEAKFYQIFKQFKLGGELTQVDSNSYSVTIEGVQYKEATQLAKKMEPAFKKLGYDIVFDEYIEDIDSAIYLIDEDKTIVSMKTTAGAESQQIIPEDVKPQIIQGLRSAYCDEILSHLQYTTGAIIARGFQRDAIVAELEQHATDELGHARLIAERIIQLGGKVPSSPQEYIAEAKCGFTAPVTDDSLQILVDNYTGEQCAIANYQELINLVKDVDYVTFDMLLDILSDEVGHETDLENFLEDLERIKNQG